MIDNVTIFWALVLTGFSFMGMMIAFMYWGDKVSRSGKKSSRLFKK